MKTCVKTCENVAEIKRGIIALEMEQNGLTRMNQMKQVLKRPLEPLMQLKFTVGTQMISRTS